MMMRDIACSNVGREAAVKFFWDEASQHNAVTLGAGSYIVSATLEFGGGRQSHVLVGNYTSIAHNVVFLSGYNHDHNRATTYPFDDYMTGSGATKNTYTEANRYQIIIGNDVWIGRGATIMGGVTIGNGAVIGANAVVTKDVPPYAVAIGSPARIIKYRFDIDVIDKIEQIKWWYWSRAQIDENLSLMKEPRKFADKFFRGSTLPPHSIIDSIRQFQASGTKVYFMAADFGVPNAVYEHVFDQYLRTFTAADNTLLIVGYTENQTPDRDKVRLPNDGGDYPAAALFCGELQALLNAATMSDVLITTRESISSICLDFASDYDVSIVSGLDEKVFERKKLREKITFAEEAPLLTIGLPTFNRLKYLRKSLAAVCEAVGNDRRVEIIVSDNDSTDRTEEFVRAVQYHYSNVIYRKNAENIGANRNFLKLYREARGKYVVSIGDDDNFTVDAINRLLETIETGADLGVILLNNNAADEGISTFEGNGTVEYMRRVSYWTTYISGIVLKKAAFDEIADPDKYDGTGLDQVYLQLSVLKKHPKFCVLSGRILHRGSGTHLPRDFAEVFIKHYFDILEAEAGLPREDFTREKLRVLNEMLLPWFRMIASGRVKLSLDGLPEIFEQYYGGEPYYEQALEQLRRLRLL